MQHPILAILGLQIINIMLLLRLSYDNYKVYRQMQLTISELFTAIFEYASIVAKLIRRMEIEQEEKKNRSAKITSVE